MNEDSQMMLFVELDEGTTQAVAAAVEAVVDFAQPDDLVSLIDVVVVDGQDDLVEGQLAFLDKDEWWKVEWQGMPEFVQNDEAPWKSMYVHFRNRDDLLEFGELMGQHLTNDTPSIWYPMMPRECAISMGYVDDV